MRSIPLVKMGFGRTPAGVEFKQVQPVLMPNGDQKVVKVGVVFTDQGQAKETLNCEDSDIRKLIEQGTLQWRDRTLAERLLKTAAGAGGNNVPMMHLDDSKMDSSETREIQSGVVKQNATLLSGTNLSWSPGFLTDQSEDWLRTELAKQRPKMAVEDMDASQLREILSSNFTK
jgi:hypothetical protein